MHCVTSNVPRSLTISIKHEALNLSAFALKVGDYLKGLSHLEIILNMLTEVVLEEKILPII
jgi:hypothetical protein